MLREVVVLLGCFALICNVAVASIPLSPGAEQCFKSKMKGTVRRVRLKSCNLEGMMFHIVIHDAFWFIQVLLLNF